MISVDLPPPETPVMQVKVPSGNSTVTFCKLLARALTTRIFCPWWPGRRLGGMAICRMPVRYWPVMLWGVAITASGLPAAGVHGGHVVAEGKPDAVMATP